MIMKEIIAGMVSFLQEVVLFYCQPRLQSFCGQRRDLERSAEAAKLGPQQIHLSMHIIA
jgi:hypothetical protein